MDTLITGVTGGLGRALAPQLAGARITGTSRSAGVRLAGVRCVAAPLDTTSWEPLVGGRDVVFHLAAYVHRPRGDDDEAAAFQDNSMSTARLARACREAGALLVFASTIAVPGLVPSGAAQASAYGRSKLAAEEAIRAEGAAGLRYVIVRFPLLYGPFGRGNMERLTRAIAQRRYWPVGSPDTPKACLAFDDAARALLCCATCPAAVGRTFVAAPQVPPTLGDIHRAAYAALGLRLPPPIPRPLAVALAAGADTLYGLLGRTSSFRDQVETLAATVACDGAELARTAGFVPRVSLAEGMERLVAWQRRTGP